MQAGSRSPCEDNTFSIIHETNIHLITTRRFRNGKGANLKSEKGILNFKKTWKYEQATAFGHRADTALGPYKFDNVSLIFYRKNHQNRAAWEWEKEFTLRSKGIGAQLLHQEIDTKIYSRHIFS